MAEPKRRALLGRIAEFRWFVQRGELAATQSLSMLLEDRPLKEALLRYLEGLTQTDLSSVEFFVPEVVLEDGGRPDLEGQDASYRPLLVVEAKFGAVLDPSQIRSYLASQLTRLEPGVRGAFVLLVPPRREQEAERVLTAALQDLKAEGFNTESVGTAVVTWEDWIREWEEDVHNQPGSSSLAGDLVQLRAMCMTLGGLVIPPLGDAALGPAWRERREDLRQIVDEVTRRFIDPGQRFPMGNEPGYEDRRYFPGGSADPHVSCSMGIGTRFADEGTTPFWLRYHKQTPGFPLVRARLHTSGFAPDIRTDDGHIWLPLEASPDAPGPELVEQLTAQVYEIVAATSNSGRASAT